MLNLISGVTLRSCLRSDLTFCLVSASSLGSLASSLFSVRSANSPCSSYAFLDFWLPRHPTCFSRHGGFSVCRFITLFTIWILNVAAPPATTHAPRPHTTAFPHTLCCTAAHALHTHTHPRFPHAPDSLRLLLRCTLPRATLVLHARVALGACAALRTAARAPRPPLPRLPPRCHAYTPLHRKRRCLYDGWGSPSGSYL